MSCKRLALTSSNNSVRINWNAANCTYDLGIEPSEQTDTIISVFGRTGTIFAQTGDYNVNQITGAAPIISPGFLGTPTAPTASPGTNSTQIATTEFVTTAINSIGPSQPAFIVTIAELAEETSTSTTDRWFITDKGKEGFFYYDPTDTTSVDDGATVIVSDTRRYKRRINDGIINVLWWGADNTGALDSSEAQQNMWDWVSAHPSETSTVLYPAGTYKTDVGVTLPGLLVSGTASPRISIIGYGARIYSEESDITLWSRMAADQSEAGQFISSWIGHIRGFIFEGDASASGQIGLRLSCMYTWSVIDCNFYSLDTGIQSEFALGCEYKNLRFFGNRDKNFVGLYGTWSGATKSNSAFNSNVLENCRVYGASGGVHSHLYLFGANGVYVRNFISEGFRPVHNIIIDSDASSVVKQNILDNIWIESTGGSVAQSTMFKLRTTGIVTIKNVHMDYPDILFDTTDSLGGSLIHFDTVHYTSALPTPAFNAGGLQIVGYNLKFSNMGNGPAFAAKLYDSDYWVGNQVPVEIFDNHEEHAGSGAYTISCGGNINLKAGNSSNGATVIAHRPFIYSVDNTYVMGAVGSLNYRPSALYVGTNGLYIDNSGRLRFGSATTTPDVTIARGAAGRIDILNNTSGMADLKVGDVFADTFYLNALNAAPLNASDTGTAGEIRIDADYIYVAVATNTWKRVALSTWP